ncbi:MAG: mitofilin family membrane protein [Alphaproteobacteria bacterium]
MTDDTDQPAGAIIDAFGGIRPMAARLDIPVSTVQGWKQRDSIPAGRMQAVRDAAEADGIALESVAGDAAPMSESVVVEPTVIDATGPETSHEAGDQYETGAENRRPESDLRSITPSRASNVAVFALLVSLGVGGWLGWTTVGPGAAGGDNARLSALEGRVARLADGPGEGASGIDVTALTRDVAALRAQLADLSAPDLESGLAPLQAEIDSLRDALVAQAADGGAGGTRGAAMLDSSLLARLDAIEVEIQNATQLASTNMQAMAGGLLEFDTRLKALADSQTESAAGLGTRIAALEAGRSADEVEISRASILALAAGQLRTALERGAPFAGPLELVETVSADDPKLDAALTTLRGMSGTGVATGSALELSFARLVPDLLAADRAATAGADGDLVQRLTGRLNDIISVRRTGANVDGDDVEARIARAEIFLADRDVVAAILEFNGLGGPAADILVPWLARARGHVDARDALRVIEEQAIARLRVDGGAQ